MNYAMTQVGGEKKKKFHSDIVGFRKVREKEEKQTLGSQKSASNVQDQHAMNKKSL